MNVILVPTHIGSKPDLCSLCPYHEIGGGFCADEGDSNTAKILFVLEGPGQEEILDGRPLTGRTGRFWEWKLLPHTGFVRGDVAIANTLRCRPPGNKYPIGKLRVVAERFCRCHDGKVIKPFHPTHWGVTYHPAALFRTPNRSKIILRALTRAGEIARSGGRPALLMGDKAMGVFVPHLKGGVKKWQGHWEEVSCSVPVVETNSGTVPVPTSTNA